MPAVVNGILFPFMQTFSGFPESCNSFNEIFPNAIAISKEDATVPAKILYDFAKTASALQLKSGVIEGTYYDSKSINVIATIPSRDELISKFLGSIQSPLYKFAYAIKAICDKENGEEAPAEA